MAMRHRWTILVFALALGAAPVRAETITVTIEKMMFTPAEVTARPGDTIEWVNRDILAHTATVNGSFEVIIPPGKSASVEFKGARSVDYYCRFHPNMKGRIVTAGGDG